MHTQLRNLVVLHLIILYGMLQQFTVENFLSFKDSATLSLKPGRGSQLKSHKVEIVKGSPFLKTAAIFGANAGGKSNFIKAIELGKYLVLHGTRSDELIDYTPFRLSAENKKKDTTLIYHIICNNKKYEYGFSYNDERISHEWLHYITRKTTYTIFSRNQEQPINMPYLQKLNPKDDEFKFLQFIAKATTPKQLFLHELFTHNIHDNTTDVSDVEAVLSWFTDTLKIIFPETPYKQGVVLKAADDEDLKLVINALLSFFDTGIDDVYLKDVEFEKLNIPLNLQRSIKADLSKSEKGETFGALNLDGDLYLIRLFDGDITAKMLMTIHHQNGSRAAEYFSLREESDGTKRLFDYIPLILDFIYGDNVFVVDEMERSLHPTLIRKILEIFYLYSNDTPSQLIFSTHESFLMTQHLLRSDEIWLMEKNEGISSLYNIDEKFNPRYDKKLRQSYLDGSYGAIPKLADNKELVEFLNKIKYDQK